MKTTFNKIRFAIIPVCIILATVVLLLHRSLGAEAKQISKLSDLAVSNALVGSWRSAQPTPNGIYTFERYNAGGTARWAVGAANRTNPATFRGAALDGCWYVSNSFMYWWSTTTNQSVARKFRPFEVHENRIISITSTSYVSVETDGDTNRMVRMQSSQTSGSQK